MFEVWYELDGKHALVQVCEHLDDAVAAADALNAAAPVGWYSVECSWEPSMDPECELA